MEIDAYLTVSEKCFLKEQVEKGIYEDPNFHLEYIKEQFDKLNNKYGAKRIAKIYGTYLFNYIKIL